MSKDDVRFLLIDLASPKISPNAIFPLLRLTLEFEDEEPEISSAYQIVLSALFFDERRRSSDQIRGELRLGPGPGPIL